MPIGAVITADIVNSTLLQKADEKKLIAAISSIFENHKLEFYRGDSFQVYMKDPAGALELILRTRALAIGISDQHDVRASIGIGSISGAVRTLKSASGEAFVLSGRSFDELTTGERIRIVSTDAHANVSFGIIASYADFVFKRLTPKQAVVVSELLLGKTQTEAAKKLKIAQATINRHAQSAAWWEIEKINGYYKQVIEQFHLS
jgi:hypothetical protein